MLVRAEMLVSFWKICNKLLIVLLLCLIRKKVCLSIDLNCSKNGCCNYRIILIKVADFLFSVGLNLNVKFWSVAENF